MGGKRSVVIMTLLGGIFLLGLLAGMHMDDATAAPAEHPRIYELRTYTTNDGSATSAPATVTVDIPCIEVGAE